MLRSESYLKISCVHRQLEIYYATASASKLLVSFVTEYASYAAVLVLYDHISTLDREIELIWRRRFSSIIMLFHLN
ncbi:hypothetical protein OBBRIDRAFT_772758 [Obba rivulosa]|uniref:DUF6533 domain-containing protein n=1 Tax=Obba rivulosa TaxID=1052685 RepID=A0A8E2B531_9APHY|nr:hypothetical protein OBBRIDRAFT_772758 [Obba rivulosa]